MNIILFTEIGDKILRNLINLTGLNQSQIRLLLFFDTNANQYLSMNQLAKALTISISTLSRQLSQEQTKTFLEFDLTSKDSTKYVHLSDKGLIKTQDLKTKIAAITNKLFAYSDQEELSFLTSELSMLNKRLNS